MSKVQPAKVATIDEVKSRVAASTTAVVTEYRGLTVAQISALRRQLRTLGADYKVFKNTLVRRAIAGTDVESLSEFLVGPTAIAFVDDPNYLTIHPEVTAAEQQALIQQQRASRQWSLDVLFDTRLNDQVIAGIQGVGP